MSKKSCFILFLCLLVSYRSFCLDIDTVTFSIQVDSLYEVNTSKTALAFAEKLNQQATEAKYLEGEVRVKTWIVAYLVNTGVYDTALSYAQRVLSIGEELNDKEIIANANLSLGNLCLATREFEKSIAYNSKAIQLFKLFDNSDGIAGAYTTIAIALGSLGQAQSALDTLLKIKSYFEKNTKGKKLYDFNVNLGIAYAQLGNYEAAIPSFEQQLAFKKAQKDTFNFAPSYGNLAYAFQNIGAFEKAFMYYDSSLYYSNLLNQGETTYITLLDMADGYQIKGDYKNALATYQNYHKTYLGVINAQTKASIAELEVKYNTQQKEKTIVENQLAIQELKQNAKIRRQQLWLLLGGLLSSIIIGLLFYYKWKADLSNKAAQEKLIQAELKNKELKTKHLANQLQNQKIDLTNLALDVSRKNEFSMQLIQRLEAIQETDKSKKDKALDEVIKFVNSQTQTNKEITFLQKNIAQINQSFYQNLENQFSNLTANDKYLSGLIRLNLSNKDIASIKGISLSSAKMSRYRLRKKLGLEPETDIVSFLQQF